MTSPLTSFVDVTFVAIAETPTANLQYDGKMFWFPPEYLSAIGSGPTNPNYIMGVRGYMQTNATTGRREWVMTNLLDQATRDAIRDIPGGLGWVNTNARQVYRDQARRMITSWNVPTADIVNIEKLLYDAAVLNDNTVP